MKLKPTSRLAKRLCSFLLEGFSTPDVVCSDTGVVIEGKINWYEAQEYTAAAVGSHYEAFGFCYVLCHPGTDETADYVAVFQIRDKKRVGYVRDPDNILLQGDFKCS